MPETIEANRIVLTDNEGRSRMVFDATNADMPSISIKGIDGGTMHLWVSSVGPQIVLERPNGKHAAVFAVHPVGATLAIYDTDVLPAITLRCAGDWRSIAVHEKGAVVWEKEFGSCPDAAESEPSGPELSS